MAHLRGVERARYVTSMFARISPRYDLLNTVMTAGRHHAWRRMAVRMAAGKLSGPALDVATGTGDFALELAREPSVSSVVGLDNTWEMLSLAARKARSRGRATRLSLVSGEAHNLPFPDNRFKCVTVGFGVRNLIDVPEALREMTRVVMPGGKVVVLEIVQTDSRSPLDRFAALCFRYVTPWLGALLAGDREAYTYLPESVRQFLSAAVLASMMREAGLGDIHVRKLALGTVAIIAGHKAR